MSSLFKKLFGGKCNCDHCGCGEKEETQKPVVENTPAPEVKPEASQEENAPKVQ